MASEFVANEQELEGGGYDADEWDIRRLSTYEVTSWSHKQLSQTVLLHKGQRVFVMNVLTEGPESTCLIEIKKGAVFLRVSLTDLFVAEPKNDEA